MPGQFINAAILCACSWFAAVEMIRLAADKDWLHKATKEIAKHWWHKRRRHMNPDADGIIPVLEGEWFQDDIVGRFREFVRVTYGEETLPENLAFIEESLGKELRKYFVREFYKDHLKTYKWKCRRWAHWSGRTESRRAIGWTAAVAQLLLIGQRCALANAVEFGFHKVSRIWLIERFSLRTVRVQQPEKGVARRGNDADAFICPVVIHRAVEV